MGPVRDREGNELTMLFGDEAPLLADGALRPLTHALVVAISEGRVLFVLNKYRQHWELPGGVIDPGESARECAARELLEESGQQLQSLRFAGLMKVYLAKGKKTEFGALYTGPLDDWAPFAENEEVAQVKLWDLEEGIGAVAEIDLALAKEFR